MARGRIFGRFLHRAYSRGTALNHFFARRIRAAGIGACLAVVLTGMIGVGQPRAAVYRVFSLTVCLTGTALVWAWLRRARALEARRFLPRHATVGETIRYTIRVTNRGKRRLASAWLLETPPDPRPGPAQFLNAREPGEEQRNLFDRVFAYYRWSWLLERRRLYEGGSSLESFRIAPGASADVSVELLPQRRGVASMDDLRVLLPDPFGLFQRCSKVPCPASTLTVLPRRYRLPPLELPGQARFQIGGDSSSNAIGNTGEFVGLRDYRHGDPLRQIHWKSWAKTGRPIVKELEDTFYPRHGMILDTFPAAGNEPAFEDAISVAASFASTLDSSETLLDLMFIKDRAHVVTAGRGIARAEKLLEVLAGVEAEAEEQFDVLARLVLRHREELTSCLVVFCGWSQKRGEFLQRLTASGLECSLIAVGHGPAPAGFPGHWVESGQLGRDLAKLPVRLKSVLAGPS